MPLKLRMHFSRPTQAHSDNAVVPIEKVQHVIPNHEQQMLAGSMEIDIFADPMTILEFAEIEVNLNILGRLID